MPEAAPPPQTPPPAPPPPPTPIDPLAPPQYVPMTPENDPDHQIKQMISRRGKPAVVPAAPPTDSASSSSSEAPAPPPDVAPEQPAAGFNDAIAGVLKFKPGPKKKPEQKPEPPAEPAAPAAPAAPEPPKTIVSKKKAAAAPASPDIAQITTAAATAAARALRGEPKPEDTATKPEESLKPEDRHDYEVAMVLAQTNPKYKDAPRVILDHIKRAETYAQRWETANPGKQFDPNDEEHNDFYETLDKPWSDFEFRKAEAKMVAKEELASAARQSEEKIKALEQDNARLELTPIIERTFIAAAGHMAKGLKVHDKLTAAGDFDKFAESDPITAEAMAATLGPIRPLIEAIVQIDDPKGRFAIDERNPVHQAWIQLLTEKEAQYSGTEHGGKMFATRVEYARMNNAQRAKHWYLTPDHLVSELLEDAVAAAAERIKAEKEKQDKIARSLGYIIPSGAIKPEPKAVATNGTSTDNNVQPHAGGSKPVSPSVGSGAKIDSKGTSTPTGRAQTLAAMGDILFPPRNPVT